MDFIVFFEIFLKAKFPFYPGFPLVIGVVPTEIAVKET